jgi:hypothetical protein
LYLKPHLLLLALAERVFDWSNMAGREKRSNERYGLDLNSMVKWEDENGTTRLMPGRIRNVSHAGAFIVCDSPIGEGCLVDVHIELPFVVGGFIRSRIFACGRVVRDTTSSKGLYGHGVRFDQLSFTRIQ